MWWPALQSLGDWLKADPDLAGVAVRYGVSNPFPAQDFIDLRYGGSPASEIADASFGDDELWIDVFKKLTGADAPTQHETGVAYQQLYTLQRAVLTSIGQWFRGTDALGGAAFNVTSRRIDPDGELFRADELAGCRIVLNINWQSGE